LKIIIAHFPFRGKEVIAALQKILVRQLTPQQGADLAAAQIKRIIAENK
jgi:hypothetical protein